MKIDFALEYFRLGLLEWYSNNGRDFPWRHTRNPYYILVAEKLLQQTSVKPSVITAYQTIIHNYSTINALASANPKILHKVISPLGLNYRAKEFVVLAKQVQSDFSGNIPRTLDNLLNLYGVGEYIARSVLSFAYHTDDVVVDVNIARILYRAFNLPGKFPSNPARKRNLYEISNQIVPKRETRYYNWAMIDLGALICKSVNPKCNNCPLKKICAFEKRIPHGTQNN